ncbi:hypothetical protein CC80DRAFT_533250 [Byssothecium circinans]|uniref:Uncharacterized protein n=1 Tax=Byssothecium circinans TaxID=147558 RepID=A0A6A5U502_9PLEO|nr:hypothetical protein CC80DRAFT_533250 [Byssothecium circinans]
MESKALTERINKTKDSGEYSVKVGIGREYMSEVFKEADIAYDVIKTDLKASRNGRQRYEKWVIGPESLLVKEIPIELSSATYDDLAVMRSAVEKLFACMETKKIKIELNESTSTQVHLSTPGEFSVQEVKKIAKSVLYWERCVDCLVSSKRVNKGYVESNHASVYFNQRKTDASIEAAIAAVEKCETVEGVALLMCTQPDGSEIAHRGFRVNFRNLLEGELGTIEFRQADGSGDAATAIAWPAFWIGFCVSAIKTGIDGRKMTMEGLKGFVVDGLETYGKADPGWVETIFEGKMNRNPTTVDFTDEKRGLAVVQGHAWG